MSSEKKNQIHVHVHLCNAHLQSRSSRRRIRMNIKYNAKVDAHTHNRHNIVQWNLVIKKSDITKPSYNKVILLVPALNIS